MNQDPILILGCHKSGTSLLRNLLDGHPDLFVIPTETHFFANIGYQVKYTFRKQQHQNLSIEEMKSSLIQWIDFRNKKDDKIGDGFTKNKWNVEALKNYLDEQKINSSKELCDCFHQGLHLSLFDKELPESKRFVVKSVENSEFVSDWMKFYPNAKFVHIVRNPYSNLVSLRKYVARKTKHPKSFFGKNGPNHFPHLRNPVLTMLDSFYDLQHNKRICKNYKVIRYEDLVADKDSIVKDVSNFLELDFHSRMLDPTVLNKSWAGNSITGQKFTGVSSINLDRWESEITEFEKIIVNKLFNSIIEEYDYKKLEVKKDSIWQRAPRESFLNYLLNRYLIYYAS